MSTNQIPGPPLPQQPPQYPPQQQPGWGPYGPQPPKRHRPGKLLLAGLAVAVAAGGVAAGLVLTSGPSYPHSWCGETLTAMYDGHQTFGQFTNALQFAANDGAPTATLLSDEQAQSQLYADEQTAPATETFTLLAEEEAGLKAIGNDARAINRACGQPSGYQLDRLSVPASGS